eukprot:scaffold44_cov411-Prasinococcus_capsulatus_cf.AAC.22
MRNLARTGAASGSPIRSWQRTRLVRVVSGGCSARFCRILQNPLGQSRGTILPDCAYSSRDPSALACHLGLGSQLPYSMPTRRRVGWRPISPTSAIPRSLAVLPGWWRNRPWRVLEARAFKGNIGHCKARSHSDHQQPLPLPMVPSSISGDVEGTMHSMRAGRGGDSQFRTRNGWHGAFDEGTVVLAYVSCGARATPAAAWHGSARAMALVRLDRE